MNNNQLVPAELLQKADKILFITHLALGDFTYLQNYFKAFAQQYPHIKVHIWVDEVRRTRCFWRWNGLQKYALYDWLAACPFIKQVYNKTYSPGACKNSLREAQAQKYPIVVSLTTLRAHKYARLARSISRNGFVVGIKNPVGFFNIFQKLAYRKLDASMSMRSTASMGKHISAIYGDWFTTLFGLQVAESKRFPFIDIPGKWLSFAKLRFLKWGIDKKTKKFGRVIFINAFAKNSKRCWPLERVAELIWALKQNDAWGDVSFVVNIVPEEMKKAKRFFEKQSLTNTFLITADYNFFQLPAILSLCDLIISVETSVMHFANAVHVPVIALMRQKNPEWVPIDQDNSTVITTLQRNEWVKDITVERVMQAVQEL